MPNFRKSVALAGLITFAGLGHSGFAHAWSSGTGSTAVVAEPVACYKQVHQPARYKTVTRRVLAHPEVSQVEVIPAQYAVRIREPTTQ